MDYFKPADRVPFTAAATDVHHHNVLGQASWWSVAFKHFLYPDHTCVMFAGEDEDYEWYGNLLLKDEGQYMKIVAEFSHMCWMDVKELPNSMEVVLDHVSALVCKPVFGNSGLAQDQPAGFLNELFQEYSPKHYTHGFSK